AGWERASLAALCKINPPLDRCVVNDAVEVNFVPMRAVESEGAGLVRPEARRYGEVKKGYTSFLSGDVIMAKITPCMENGKTTLVPNLPGAVCFGSTEFHVIRPETGISARWIAAFLVQHEFRRNAQRAMTGGVGQMRVPAAFLESVSLPIAPTVEQELIADALDELISDLDAGIGALDRVRAKLKVYRASVLKAAIEGALTAEWREQHPQSEPASDLLKRILVERRCLWEAKQLRTFEQQHREPPKNWKAKYREPAPPDATNLPVLPHGWCWASIEQLISEVTNGFGKRAQVSGNPRIVLRLADVEKGEIIYDHPRRINCTDGDIEKYGLIEHDLLVVRVNGSPELVGRFIFIREMPERPLFCDHFIRARCVFRQTAAWLRTYADTNRFRHYIDLKKVSSAGQNTISQAALFPVAVPLPPASEQDSIREAIENQLSVIDHLEIGLEAKQTSTQALRQSILRHAFSGKLVLGGTNRDSASELLKRIAADREQRTREAAAAKRSNGHKTRRGSSAGNRTKPTRNAKSKDKIDRGHIADR